jgi:ketosteroid isomerase-like protein
MADVEAIMRVVDEWDEAVSAADIDATLSLYAGVAVAMAPNEPQVSGPGAIREWFEALHARGAVEIDYEVGGLEGTTRQRVIGYGTYALSVTPERGEPVLENGKWVAVFLQQPDRSWKITQHIWNSDRPALAGAP